MSETEYRLVPNKHGNYDLQVKEQLPLRPEEWKLLESVVSLRKGKRIVKHLRKGIITL